MAPKKIEICVSTPRQGEWPPRHSFYVYEDSALTWSVERHDKRYPGVQEGDVFIDGIKVGFELSRADLKFIREAARSIYDREQDLYAMDAGKKEYEGCTEHNCGAHLVVHQEALAVLEQILIIDPSFTFIRETDEYPKMFY